MPQICILSRNYANYFENYWDTSTSFISSAFTSVDIASLRELQKGSVNWVCENGMHRVHNKPGAVFTARRVRGSLHKRACERNDPCVLDLMPNVCSQVAAAAAAAASVCFPLSVSKCVLRDLPIRHSPGRYMNRRRERSYESAFVLKCIR